MTPLQTLGLVLGTAFAAGLNVYATVATLGLLQHFEVIALPPTLAGLAHPVVIGVAVALFVVEFVADKVPWVDTLWDTAHTVVRPLGGALIAVSTLGEASPWIQGLAALAGGTLAAGGHLTKAGTRAAANMSPEPFSNWALSLAEDVFVVGLGALALAYPVAALVVTTVAVVVIVLLLRWLIGWIRRAAAPPDAAASTG